MIGCIEGSLKLNKENDMNYLYVINYPVYEKDLCMMEMRALFGMESEDKVIMSEREFNPSHSPFIKKRLDVIYEEDTLEEVLEKLEATPIHMDGFKGEYLRLEEGNVTYEERLRSLREIGQRVVGVPSMTDPKGIIGVTKYRGKWYLGICQNNDYRWNEHDNKPCTYSNSIGLRPAKAIVNIANNGEAERRVVDACCGVGTLLIEGLDAGYDICGYELSPKTTANAKENLRYFGLPERVTNMDMNLIEESYDASIIDIPYGIFSHTTSELQQEMIDTARRISKRLVLISFEDLESLVANAGFKIVDRCTIAKGRFVRYIWVCE